VKKPVEDDDLISFIVSGLNPLFNTFVIVHSFIARTTEMTFANFQFELLNHEMLLENQQHKTATPETAALHCTSTSKALPTSALPILESQDSHQDQILAANSLLPKTTVAILQETIVVTLFPTPLPEILLETIPISKATQP
jgi:hypothetical protein